MPPLLEALHRSLRCNSSLRFVQFSYDLSYLFGVLANPHCLHSGLY